VTADDEARASIATSAAAIADNIAYRILDRIDGEEPDHINWSHLKAADDVLQVAARFRARAQAIGEGQA
jgi:hypothetical protein